MDGATEMVLLGWYDEESFIKWDTRLCLEPNWDPEVVDYFKAKGTKAVVYSDKSLSTKSVDSPTGARIAKTTTPTVAIA